MHAFVADAWVDIVWFHRQPLMSLVPTLDTNDIIGGWWNQARVDHTLP